MLWSFPVARFAGTIVRIHLTFLLLLAWIFVDSYFASGLEAASRALIFVVAVFACVVAHEFGHVLVARLFGVGTSDITLYPFGGIARLNTIPQDPLSEFLIAVAGPVVNVIIAGALLLFAGASIDPSAASVLTSEQAGLATRLATTNVVLAAFNLIPAFPMDGGRLLRAALAARFGFERATRIAATAGHWIAFAFAVIGLFFNPMLIVIAVFVFFAATAEMQATAVRAFSIGLPVTRAMITQFATLPASGAVADAVEILLRTSQRAIPVTDDSGKFSGIVEIGNVIKALNESNSSRQSVADIMTADVPTLPETASLDAAFRLLQEKSAPAVAIVDGASRPVGLVTFETLGEMLMLHEASASVFDRLQPGAGSVPLASRRGQSVGPR